MSAVVIKSYHSPELAERIRNAWDANELLIIAPPNFPGIDNYLAQIPRDTKAVFGLFSTGTLGSKLLLYTKENIEASLTSILSFFDLEKIDSVFCYPQTYHVFGLVLGNLFSHHYQKDFLFLEGPYRTETHDAWMKEARSGTLTLGTPTHFQDLLHYVRSKALHPRASYSCIVGGAPVTKQLWFDVRSELKIEAPSIGYGASELSPGATHLAPGREPLEDFELGEILPGVQVWEQQDGLIARGANVCEAIITESGITFPKEILLRDRITRRSDGVYVFGNRADLVLNRGGEKFSLEKIEQYLKSSFNVDGVAVAIKHPRLGEELALVLEGKVAPEVIRSEIYPALAKMFGREFDSSLCLILDRLPTNRNSKVDRQRCRVLAEEGCVSA